MVASKFFTRPRSQLSRIIVKTLLPNFIFYRCVLLLIFFLPTFSPTIYYFYCAFYFFLVSPFCYSIKVQAGRGLKYGTTVSIFGRRRRDTKQTTQLVSVSTRFRHKKTEVCPRRVRPTCWRFWRPARQNRSGIPALPQRPFYAWLGPSTPFEGNSGVVSRKGMDSRSCSTQDIYAFEELRIFAFEEFRIKFRSTTDG